MSLGRILEKNFVAKKVLNIVNSLFQKPDVVWFRARCTLG